MPRFWLQAWLRKWGATAWRLPCVLFSFGWEEKSSVACMGEVRLSGWLETFFNSVICEFHFEDRLIRKGKRWTHKWKLNPMPTMMTDEMKAMPQSVQPTQAAPPRKPPAKRTYQEDEINAFLSQDIIGDFSELNSTHAPPGFQCTKSDNSIVFFNLTYVDGFPVIFESIKVDQSLHVQLQFNGHPVPGMCGQHVLKFLIGFLPRLTFVVQNITIGDWNLLQR